MAAPETMEQTILRLKRQRDHSRAQHRALLEEVESRQDIMAECASCSATYRGDDED